MANVEGRIIERDDERWYEFDVDGEKYAVPLVQYLPSRFVIDAEGDFCLTAGKFTAVLYRYVGASIVGDWTIKRIGEIFDQWDDACGRGPEGVTTGE